MNNKDCCRTCLGKTKEMQHINSSVTISGHEVRLSDILFNFYSYQVNSTNSKISLFSTLKQITPKIVITI